MEKERKVKREDNYISKDSKDNKKYKRKNRKLKNSEKKRIGNFRVT